jgi:hypothetical protein
MHDDGTCVKADWEKAVNLYMLALQAGSQTAAPRLVAGYARPSRDNGMALWWVAKSMLPAGSRASAFRRRTRNATWTGSMPGWKARGPKRSRCVFTWLAS